MDFSSVQCTMAVDGQGDCKTFMTSWCGGMALVAGLLLACLFSGVAGADAGTSPGFGAETRLPSVRKEINVDRDDGGDHGGDADDDDDDGWKAVNWCTTSRSVAWAAERDRTPEKPANKRALQRTTLTIVCYSNRSATVLVGRPCQIVVVLTDRKFVIVVSCSTTWSIYIYIHRSTWFMRL